MNLNWTNRSGRELSPVSILISLFGLFVLLIPQFFVQEAQAASIKGKVQILDGEGKFKENHKGVIVFLDEMDPLPDLSDVKRKRVTIRQYNKRFMPEVVPIPVGSIVDFPNEDLIFHNVFSLSKAKPFDLGLYKQGTSRSVIFDQTGLIKIYCNIHPQMIAYVLVLGNSFFAVSDQKGYFLIKDVLPGLAKLRTWYPRALQHQERDIRITEDDVMELNSGMVESIEFTIREEVVDISHKNKYGQNYRPSDYASA